MALSEQQMQQFLAAQQAQAREQILVSWQRHGRQARPWHREI
jgi:hypothetical protein